MVDLSLPEFQIRELTNGPDLEPIYALRVTAWRTRLNLSTNVQRWKDPEDQSARHWAIYNNQGLLAAAARMSVHERRTEVPEAEIYLSLLDSVPTPICSLNRCVVHPDFRGRGLSSLLDSVRVVAAADAGCKSVIVAVDEPLRKRHLVSQGFRVLGEALPYSAGILKGVSNSIYIINP